VEFHIHTYMSLLIVRVMLSQNITRNSDQPIVYVSRLVNKVKHNYNTTEREALIMIFLYTSSDII
jgi:hypothetical protein